MKHMMLFLALALSLTACTQPTPETVANIMNNDTLGMLIKRFDAKAESQPGFWQLTHEDMVVYVISDDEADRMRIIVQIADAEQLEKEHLHRLMQANFDTALDARYAIAQGGVWSVFLHPLGSLSEHEFFSGLAQVITLARSFGSSFSSGALSYGGGDSVGEQKKLYESLLKKGLSL
jgi:hypothetical protein